MQIHPESRECPLCRFRRIPYAKVVTKNKKHWIIFTCPLCKHRDIDTYIPRRLLNGLTGRFEEEDLPDEDTPE